MLPRGIAWHSPGAGSAVWFLLVCLVFLVGFLFCFVFSIHKFLPHLAGHCSGPFPWSWRALLTPPSLLPNPSAFFLFQGEDTHSSYGPFGLRLSPESLPLRPRLLPARLRHRPALAHAAGLVPISVFGSSLAPSQQRFREESLTGIVQDTNFFRKSDVFFFLRIKRMKLYIL